MEVLGAAASVAGVVSLAFQLIQVTQNLRDFFNDVSGAPSEIRRLAMSLTQLGIILRDVQAVTEIQQEQEGAPPPPLSLLDSLEACEEKLLLLKRIVDSSDQRQRASGRVSRHWESFKVVFKKKDIERFGEHFREAIQSLTLAMMMNLTVLNLAGLEMTTSFAQLPRHPAMAATSLTETSALCSLSTRERPSTAITRRTTTSRFIKSFTLPFNSPVLRIAYTRKTKVQQSDGQDSFHVKESVVCISSTMLGYYISLCFKNPYGSISHSLQVDPIADFDALIFDLCEKGDISGVQDMFTRRIISPFVRNPSGRTLLHYAAEKLNANLINFLLDYGVDASKTEHIFNDTPLQLMGIKMYSPDSCVDAMRALITKGQNDPMDLDILGHRFFEYSIGSGDGYLFILNQEEFSIDINQTGDHALHTIAKNFAFSYFFHDVPPEKRLKSWEPALRRAIQLGLSLTPKVPGTKTALDSLFMGDYSQVDSVLLAQEWLSLLAAAGMNVDDYIREEKRIHDSGFLHWVGWYGRKRRIIFEEGSSKKQSIRWEWFYSPEEPAYNVLSEFSELGNIFPSPNEDWKWDWPFFYVETIKGLVHKSWSDEEKAGIDSKWAILQARRPRQAARRQHRSEYSPRFKKPSRSYRRLRVPGAWVEDDFPISIKWPRRRIFNFPWWMYLFILGVALLISGLDFGFMGVWFRG